jgi:hypothetical protein
MKRILLAISMATAVAVSGAAIACGACVEDKVAATYDHAVIAEAIRKHRQVAFVTVDAPRVADVRRRIAAAARKVRSIDMATMRTSDSPAALSFVVARSEAPEHAVAGLREALRDPGVQLTLVRVMRDGALIDPK